jgi:hypothetical protein
MFAEESRIRANWQDSGITDAQIEYLTKHQKMPLEQVFKNLYVA